MMNPISKLLKWLEVKIVLPDDTPSDYQRKVVSLVMTLAGIIAVVIWAILLIMMGFSVIGIFMLLVSCMLVLTIIFFLSTQQFRMFFSLVMTIALISPFIIQFLLGGFALSGFSSLWSLPCTSGAAIFLGRRNGYFWMLAYVVLMLASAALDGVAKTLAPELSDMTRTILFAWNGIILGFLIFLPVQSILRETEAARDRADKLLLNVLPKEIATILKGDHRVMAEHFDEVSILFADVVNFTPMAAKMTPAELVGLLDELFSQFDNLVEGHTH